MEKKFYKATNLTYKPVDIKVNQNYPTKYVNDRSSCSEVFLVKVLWKYAANLQEDTHAEVWFE